jgi:long-chain acyl-CoA synthetase
MFETLTSGSSGAPRRIRRTQRSWIDSFAVNARLFDIGPGVAVAVLGRLEHSLALYGALEALHLGAELHLMAGLRPDRQMQALAARGVAVLYATPVQIRLMLEAPRPGPAPGLRHMLVGGAKLDPATRAACRGAFPAAKVREFYGAAETSFIAMSDDDTPEGAVGRPYQAVEISIRDDADNPVPEGATGRIWVRSPYLFEGYAWAAATDTRWRDGWLTIGEHGALRDGQLHLVGRESRMITISDQNVFPEEVEAFLLAQPGVTRAAVLAACRAGLGPMKAPRRVAVRQDWPLLPSGKTDLAALERALT